MDQTDNRTFVCSIVAAGPESEMEREQPKRLMFGHVAAVGRAFANPLRVELVDLLVQAPRSVEMLAALTEQSHANVSQHLQLLRGAGVVRSTRRGKSVFYALTDVMLFPIYMYLSAVADRIIAEAQRTRRDLYATLDAEQPLSLSDLGERRRQGSVTVIDVRPLNEFEHDHMPGALSMPVMELSARFAELPGDGLVAAYCRGPHCTYAYEAVSFLRARGRRAQRIEGGYLGWRTCRIDARLRSFPCPD